MVDEEKITDKQYQEAWEIISKMKKQNKLEKAKTLRKDIEQYENTYWKKTESMMNYNYYHIIGSKGHFEVIRFASYKNGLIKINREYLEAHNIESFLGQNLARQSDVFSDDDEEQTCHCPQLENPHWKDQHTGLEQIEHQQFKDEVQINVLNKMGGGLIFG